MSRRKHRKAKQPDMSIFEQTQGVGKQAINGMMHRERSAQESIEYQLTSLYEKLNKVNKSSFLVRKPRQSEETNRRSRRAASLSEEDEFDEGASV